tara:strand:+ start:341 stop:607 length:267 start_codon:yes stop_codon:yes gene_type:complete
MKLTKQKLRDLIKEELEKNVEEGFLSRARTEVGKLTGKLKRVLLRRKSWEKTLPPDEKMCFYCGSINSVEAPECEVCGEIQWTPVGLK